MRRAVCALLLACAAFTAPTVSAVAGDAAPTPPTITLLAPGKAPRAEIRYALAAGARQAIVLGVNTSITQKVGDRPTVQGSSPIINVNLSVTVDSVTADGAASLSFSFDGVKVDGKDVAKATAAERAALEPVIGIAGTLTITSRGEVTASDITVPPGLAQNAAQFVEQLSEQSRTLSVPFPAEAIGVGARWEARTEAQINGIRVTQTARYELVRRRGDTVDLSVRITQRAPRQTYTDPASGTKVELRSSKGNGDGKTKVTLGDPLPHKSDVHIHVDQSLRIKGQPVTQSVSINAFINP